MSVSPFSAQHDTQVQQYKILRAAWKAEEKQKKADAKLRRATASQHIGSSATKWQTSACSKLWHLGRKSQLSGSIGEARVVRGWDEQDADEITLHEALKA
jgi:hypothetical protein